jgi:hypothetical protein
MCRLLHLGSAPLRLLRRHSVLRQRSVPHLLHLCSALLRLLRRHSALLRLLRRQQLRDLDSVPPPHLHSNCPTTSILLLLMQIALRITRPPPSTSSSTLFLLTSVSAPATAVVARTTCRRW